MRRDVALVVDVHQPYDRKVVAGITQHAYAVAKWNIHVTDDPRSKIASLKRWRGDGVIANLDDEAVSRFVSELDVPVVGIGNAQFDDACCANLPYVGPNNEAIGQIAAAHLLERGFQNFAFYGKARSRLAHASVKRGESFGQSVAVRCASFSECRVRKGTNRDTVDHELMAWLATLPKPVGLFACDDALARRVIDSCRELGLRVPEDVAVIGTDNDELYCQLAHPALSSIIQGTETIGLEAARMLDRLMAGDDSGHRRLLVDPMGVASRVSTDTLAVADSTVARAIQFIRDRVSDGIQVGDVTAHVSLSRSALDIRFRGQLSRTVHDEIERERIRLTKELLASTEIPPKDVAMRAGFKSVQYMSTAFRRVTGQTPGYFRRVSQRDQPTRRNGS